MKKQHTLWLAVILTLVGSLMAVPIATGAQQPLTETFTWTGYELTISYPAGWTLRETATRVSLYPADRDVSDGAGPELILFRQPDITAAQIDQAITALQGRVNGSASDVQTGTWAGLASRSFDFTQLNPAAQGSLTLIALDAQTVVGVAYIVRAGDTAAYLPVLQAMADSLSRPTVAPLALRSVSTASVQLPQVYAWDAVGLSLALPADWTISALDADRIEARPANTSDATGSITVIRLDSVSNPRDTLRLVMATPGAPAADIVDVTINGMTGLTAEYVESASSPALTVRLLLLDRSDVGAWALISAASAEADWPAFRPVVSAIIGSLAPVNSRFGGLSARPAAENTLSLISAPVPQGAPLPRQDTATRVFVWEEMGLTLDIPADWEELPTSQDYDLALVSPAAMQGGSGAFMTFNAIPYVGSSFEDAMQPLAEQVNSTVEPFSVAELDGVRVVATDSGSGGQQWLVLLPYGTGGESLYIQGIAPDGDAGTLDAIFASMVIAPLSSDADAINAAWQASLADNGTLTYGSPDAPALLVEYFSFTCGHCANYSSEMERLIALEVDGTERVRFELAPVMWDEYANRTARALYCAVEQGQGYSAYKALFQGYFAEGYDVAYSADGVNAIMSDLGLDMDAFATCVEDDRYADVIAAVETRFRDSGITGTPTVAFGVNGDDPMPIPLSGGSIWSGRIPLSTLREVLTKLLDEGIPLAEVFSQ